MIPEYQEQIQIATGIWRKGNWNPDTDIPGIPSSIHHDAIVLTLHALYWSGRVPTLHKSRGHSWKLNNETVEIKNWRDHRDGVVGWAVQS